MNKDAGDASPLRALPSVDAVLNTARARALAEQHGRARVSGAVRAAVESRRQAIRGGEAARPDAESLAEAAAELLAADRPNLRRVVNATGIVLHTGLGRAVLPGDTLAALAEAVGNCNVQMDLETGERTRREAVVLDLFRRVTGAEDAAVVNNNAAATLLVLAALSRGREAVVSRGELIEIGGSFRLPDIMAESGALLREVGTTNKTHLRDYEKAIGPGTGLLLKVHPSNYRVEGFVAETALREIAALGRTRSVPVIFDLGSGNLVDLRKYGLEGEPTVQDGFRDGADLVLFSTDKLIGGPQGGAVVGRTDLVTAVRKHPLYRAFRVDKLRLAALEHALRLFLEPDKLEARHPTYFMLARKPDELRRTAEELRAGIAKRQPAWQATVVEEESKLGGGALPTSPLPTFAVSLRAEGLSADRLALALRRADPPVIGRIRDDLVLLDVRTILPGETEDVLRAIERLAP
ncbi:MAG TPA: L-seryl-tRNA(Sec) selenium transferase [Kiritimatiellia bacterium]|nr:L-seryl-tRNA(Sec) selenium transferase [Kiritimatiellia bacterium]HRZ12075.1 L-seryl-tRNA(Sec) selenium transferase [Kiritimatiellia bacterium]HSA18167.1 L-seryl-tRNA(Sec) selenium transferase [Kiritimatiellia bacterium]